MSTGTKITLNGLAGTFFGCKISNKLVNSNVVDTTTEEIAVISWPLLGVEGGTFYVNVVCLTSTLILYPFFDPFANLVVLPPNEENCPGAGQFEEMLATKKIEDFLVANKLEPTSQIAWHTTGNLFYL